MGLGQTIQAMRLDWAIEGHSRCSQCRTGNQSTRRRGRRRRRCHPRLGCTYRCREARRLLGMVKGRATWMVLAQTAAMAMAAAARAAAWAAARAEAARVAAVRVVVRAKAEVVVEGGAIADVVDAAR